MSPSGSWSSISSGEEVTLPPEVVEPLIRLVDDVLRRNFDCSDGLASADVTLADPPGAWGRVGETPVLDNATQLAGVSRTRPPAGSGEVSGQLEANERKR